MKFQAVIGVPADDAVLDADYKAAEVFWKVRLGQRFLFYASLFKTMYIPISEIDRAFIRVETTVSRVCCGPAEFNSYYLIICHADAEAASVELDSEVKADRILAGLSKLGIATGKLN